VGENAEENKGKEYFKGRTNQADFEMKRDEEKRKTNGEGK